MTDSVFGRCARAAAWALPFLLTASSLPSAAYANGFWNPEDSVYTSLSYFSVSDLAAIGCFVAATSVLSLLALRVLARANRRPSESSLTDCEVDLHLPGRGEEGRR